MVGKFVYFGPVFEGGGAHFLYFECFLKEKKVILFKIIVILNSFTS